MAVTWVFIVAILGLVLVPVLAAAIAGFWMSRKQSHSANQEYFWDDQSQK